MFNIAKFASLASPGGSGWKQCLASAVLALGTALALPAAQAGAIDFEGVQPGFLMDGDSFQHAGYVFSGSFVGAPGEGGGLVGAVIDGSDWGLCANFACPLNNATQYLGAINDGQLQMSASNQGVFHLGSFDASFFGDSDSFISGVLQLTGVRADGSTLDEYYALTSALNGFQHYETSADFAANNFANIVFSGYSCNFRGSCNAFNSDKGQFALDNLSTSVPEPSNVLLLGLGFVLMVPTLRRRAN
jgi:hypothetical protein